MIRRGPHAARRGRPGAALVLAGIAAALAFGGCAAGAPRTTFPPIGSTPRPVDDAANATKALVLAALAAAGVQATDAVRAYRPPEGALLAAAPRSVLQAILPDDPTHGYIVVYALDTPAAAAAAAADHAAYVGGNLGRIQFPTGTRFVIRVIGSSVVFYSWLPEGATAPQAATIADALATIGDGVAVPD